MHAEILAIGTELTTGAKLDTNSQWLSLELSAHGIPVRYHVTVADDFEANLAVVRQAVERSDLVLITGGLGPTLDDLTRDVLAKLIDQPLVLDPASLELIRGMFSRRNRPMPERNAVQAMFPEGSTVIPNPRGTAPGIYLEVPRPGQPPCRVAAMPGVPSEMKPMFRDWVLPRVADLGGGMVIRHARIHCFGLGESAFEELLGDVTARGRDPEVGITAHEATITLRIVAEAPTAAECDAKIAATQEIIHERLGKYIFGVEDEELQHAVVARLQSQSKTLGVIESATGGLIGRWLHEVPGSHERVLASLTVANPLGEAAVLGLPPQMGSLVSREAARRMAETWRLRVGCDLGLAVTGIAPQDPAVPDSPPVAFFALADGAETVALEINLTGDPAIQRSRTAKSALDLVRQRLLP